MTATQLLARSKRVAADFVTWCPPWLKRFVGAEMLAEFAFHGNWHDHRRCCNRVGKKACGECGCCFTIFQMRSLARVMPELAHGEGGALLQKLDAIDAQEATT